MGGGDTTSQTPISRPPSLSQLSPALAPSTPPACPSGLDVCDPLVAKYPYFLAAHKARPKVYQSPYASGGGFTMTYLPNAAVPKPEKARNRSLSEDFLLKRTLSQQELLKTHKRQEGENKAPPQPDSNHNPRHNPSRAPSSPSSNPIPLDPSIEQFPSYYPPHQYQYNPPPAYFNPLQNPPSQPLYDPSPPSLPRQPGGLQFQSPHDFQMQMQREAQQQEWAKSQGGFDQFFRGLQKAAGAGGADGDGGGGGNGSGGSGSSGGGGGDGGGTQSSPLKYEMGGGGEMLPMMGDRF